MIEDKKLLAEFLGYEVKYGSELDAGSKFFNMWGTIECVPYTKADDILYYRISDDNDLDGHVYKALTNLNHMSLDILFQASQILCNITEIKYSVETHALKTAWSKFNKEEIFNTLIEGIKHYK